MAAELSIKYFGISIQCSSKDSARLVCAILSQDLGKVDNAIDVGCANLNDLFPCWTQHRNLSSSSYTLTPLSLAVRFSTRCIVRTLLRHGVDPNVKCDMTPLGIAVQRNNKRMVALLLDSGSDVNLPTHPVTKWMSSSGDKETSKQTPLHIACRKDLVDMATYLLLKQAATDVVDGSGNTPAEVARNYGCRQVEKQILRALHPAASNCPNTSTSLATPREQTFIAKLLVASIRNDTMKARVSIAFTANVNGADASLNTPLHYACYHGNQKLADALLENGAYADILNGDRKSPIYVALEYGYLQTLFVFIEHKYVLPRELLFATNSRGNTLLHIACKQNRVLVVKQLIKLGAFLHVTNNKGKSSIHYAWQKKRLDLRRTVVDYIFQYSQSESTIRWKRFFRTCVVGLTQEKRYLELLQYAMLIRVVSGFHGACSGELINKNLCSACGKLSLDGCHFLLSRGVRSIRMSHASCCCTTHKKNFFTSLLHIACSKKSSAKMLKQLIENGADVNAVDCQGNTPLHLACYRESACMSVISTLLDHGASPYVVNGNNKTALGCAFSMNYIELVRWLILQKEIDIDAEVLRGFNDEENTLLLMLATIEDRKVDAELLWRLVERGARINVPRHQTVDRGYHVWKQQRLLDVLTRKDDNWSLVRKLIEVGCCDFSNEIFNTLLHPPPRWHQISKERLLCLNWLLLAGFGQYDESTTYRNTGRFVREFLWQVSDARWRSDAQVSTYAEGEEKGAKAETRATAKAWLEHNVENPRSLSCLCIYTIRQQLVCADPAGKSIFPSIDQLPLPTKLKNMLKLRDIESKSECFNKLYKPRSFSSFFYDLHGNDPFGQYDESTTYHVIWYNRPRIRLPLWPSLCSSESDLSLLPRCIAKSNEESVFHAKTDQSTYRHLQKRNYTRQNVPRKLKVSLSFRSSRSLVQPRRHCH